MGASDENSPSYESAAEDIESSSIDHPSIQRALNEILANEEDGLTFSSHVSHSSAVE